MENQECKKQRKEQITMIILSVIDVLFGVLSIVFTAMAVQIIATIASGATLGKAISITVKSQKGLKIALQSTKSANIIKSVQPYAKDLAVKAIPAVLAWGTKQILKKEKGTTMKEFFKKLGVALKNNPVTVTSVVIEGILCVCGGHCLNLFVDCFNTIPAPYNYVLSVGVTLIVYVALSILTIYLGYDNELLTKVRSALKAVGNKKTDEIVVLLDNIVEEVKVQKEAEEAEAKAKAEAEAEEEAIYQKAMAEKKAQEEAEKKALEDAELAKAKAEKDAIIAQYKANHPTVL